MNLTESAESHIKSKMDKHAFEINVCLQALSKYGQAATQLEVLEKIKSQIEQADKENTDEN